MLFVRNRLSCVGILAVTLTGAVDAEDTANSKQMDQILTELRQIRKLLEGQPNRQAAVQPTMISPTTIGIDVANAPFLGSKDAPVAVVEFLDYECPPCQQFHQQAFQDLKKSYIDSGKVRFYAIDLPHAGHQNALAAAQAGRCASDQGQFWAMHDRMLENPKHLELSKLVEYAGALGIDAAAFRQCLESARYKEQIEQRARQAMNKGVRGTPAFVIGKSTSNSVEGELLIGAPPFAFFDMQLKERLSLTPGMCESCTK
jgi:protein-disulfide isomerase